MSNTIGSGSNNMQANGNIVNVQNALISINTPTTNNNLIIVNDESKLLPFISYLLLQKIKQIPDSRYKIKVIQYLESKTLKYCHFDIFKLICQPHIIQII